MKTIDWQRRVVFINFLSLQKKIGTLTKIIKRNAIPKKNNYKSNRETNNEVTLLL